MKPKLENFPGGSRSPDVLAAEAARSARDPFPRECLGWSEIDVSGRHHGYGSVWSTKKSIRARIVSLMYWRGNVVGMRTAI